MRRSYSTIEEVIPKVKDIIMDLRSKGERVLPSERQLEKMVGASRMTLRKSLEQLENSGILCKEAGTRMIEGVISKKYSADIALVASGWDYPTNPVWLQLIHSLENKLQARGFNSRTVLFGWGDIDEIWPGGLATLPDYMVFMEVPSPQLVSRIMSLQDKVMTIFADENYLGKVENIVAIDNYQMGFDAALALLRSGSKNPACICGNQNYLPFRLRCEGFCDALAQNGLSVENRARIIPIMELHSHKYLLDLMETTKKVVEEGYDGLFVNDDSNIHIVHDIISQTYKIPNEFSLIAVEAKGEVTSSETHIGYLSRSISDISERIVDLIECHINKSPYQKINLIKSEVINGFTLNK